MSTQPTPGPWFADVGETVTIRDQQGNQVAIFTHLNTKTGGRRNPDEVAKNARIAAAAPELLAACQLFIEYEKAGDLDDGVAMMLAYEAAHDAIRSAIAKATGEQA